MELIANDFADIARRLAAPKREECPSCRYYQGFSPPIMKCEMCETWRAQRDGDSERAWRWEELRKPPSRLNSSEVI